MLGSEVASDGISTELTIAYSMYLSSIEEEIAVEDELCVCVSF